MIDPSDTPARLAALLAEIEALKAHFGVNTFASEPPIRAKMERFLLQHLQGVATTRVTRASEIIDGLLRIMDADPGHDATAGAVNAGDDRRDGVNAYRSIIQAIRRGE